MAIEPIGLTVPPLIFSGRTAFVYDLIEIHQPIDKSDSAPLRSATPFVLRDHPRASHTFERPPRAQGHLVNPRERRSDNAQEREQKHGTL